jgi:hypothetical protein
MFTHPEYQILRQLGQPKNLREEELSDAIAALFIADAETVGADDWNRQYSVSFVDRVRLMDEFADITTSRFIELWNYEAAFWRSI